jgi:ATP-dependent Clp protease ATP-binding subunit ClpC
MGLQHLQFPALVRREKRAGRYVYAVRPLFLEEPEGTGRVLDAAVRNCLKGVRDHFHPFTVRRDTLDDLLWFRFDPELETRPVRVETRSGRHHLSGEFTAAWFDLGSLRLVCLPGFGSHLFVARPDERGRYPMDERIQEEILRLLRAERKEMGEEAPPPEDHMSVAGETVTRIDTTVWVKDGDIVGTAPCSFSFASLFDEADLDGAEEIRKVAADLALLHPDGLRRWFGPDEPVEQVRRALFEGKPSATVLIGPPGTGKTTAVHEALRRAILRHPDVPLDSLQKVWHLDPNRVVTGMRVVGMWQRRFEEILAYLRDRILKSYGRRFEDALFVDNPVALLRVGRSAHNNMNLADVMKAWIEKGELRVVAEATAEGWSRVQEMNRGFADLFRVVRFSEPSRDAALPVFIRHRSNLEEEFRCRIRADAFLRVLELEGTYSRGKGLPGSVVEALRQLAFRHRGGEVRAAQVDEAFQASTGLSSELLSAHPFDERGGPESGLRHGLVGQEEAVACMADLAHLVKARLCDPERPFASLLFAGPTGVGKTEAAKQLADLLFDDPRALVRLDMNEYVDEDAAARLTGDLQRPEGQMTGRVRYRPFCLLLLDEIEKAHPAVHDLLLQVLGEGRLSDGEGRTVSFANTVIVMTSNLGSKEAQAGVGFGEAAGSAAARYRKAVEEFFRPEFVNRIDRIVAFRPLDVDDVKAIARIRIEGLLRRDGLVRRWTALDVSPAALAQVAEGGFDAQMGGRALRRALERDLAGLAAGRLSASPPDRPVLIGVGVRGGALHPRVTTLEFAGAGPAPARIRLPEEKELPSFLGFIERRAGEILDGAEAEVEARGWSWNEAARDPEAAEFLGFRDAVREFRRRAADRLERLRQARVPRGAGLRAATRGGRKKVRLRDWGDLGDSLRERLCALYEVADVARYFDELYDAGREVAKESQAGALADLLRLAALDFRWRHLSSGRRESACLHFRVRAEGPREEGLDILAAAYRRLCASFGGVLERVGPPAGGPDGGSGGAGDRFFLAAGAGLYEFFRMEEGFHLFFFASRFVPVQVRVLPVPPGADAVEIARREIEAHDRWTEDYAHGGAREEDDPFRPGPVLRLYAPGAGKEGRITDLRTGLIAPLGEDGETDRDAWFAWTFGALGEGNGLDLGGW